MVPSVEAERATDALERDDNKPWDEDFKLALMLAFDRFAAERLAEYATWRDGLKITGHED